MNHSEILTWLQENNPRRVEELYARADQIRRDAVGDEVHLRALVEISNYCLRSCSYCGIRSPNRHLSRYRMSGKEVVGALATAAELGCGTAVLQAGEDPALTVAFVTEVIRRIKGELGLAVTLSLGERSPSELRAYRQAGADRYLLRFETSNRRLLARLHPPLPSDARSRLDILDELYELGFEVGSGVMVGLPGSSYDDLARDLTLFRELDLDMIGVGPYIPHPFTPMGARPRRLPDSEQVPSNATMSCKVIALARLLCPSANIPATTALATITPHGRDLGLQRGANVWMPNFTPHRFRERYEIYPGKAAPRHPEVLLASVHTALARLGRRAGVGSGRSPHFAARQRSA